MESERRLWLVFGLEGVLAKFRVKLFPLAVMLGVLLSVLFSGCMENLSFPMDLLVQSKTSTIAVDAGPSQTGMVGQTVVLNSMESSLLNDGEILAIKDVLRLIVLNDNSIDPISFQWEQISGPPVTLEDSTCPVTLFVAPEAGTYVFKLTISNRAGSADDTVEIVINSVPMPVAAVPVFNPEDGEFTGTTEISITCATQNATIYYTLDGSEPGSSSSVYNGPIRLSATTTVKAKAAKADFTDSAVVSATFTGYVDRPSLSSNEGVIANTTIVTLSCPTQGATICYTLDGSEPGPAAAVYREPISMTGTTTIKAKACKTGLLDSQVVTSTITAGHVASPSFSSIEASSLNSTMVTLSCATEGATIYYTLDGSEPGPAAAVYQAPISVTTTTTIKAKACKAGLLDSQVVTSTITTGHVASPSFSSNEGSSLNSTTVTLSCATGGATIYYTLDGSEPGPAAAVYQDPISVTTTTTIKAKACKAGLLDSQVVTSTVTTGHVANPNFSAGDEDFTDVTTVTMSCATPGAAIHYTLDGREPNTSDPVYGSPLSITATATIKAMAVKAGWLDSQVATTTITRRVTNPVINPAANEGVNFFDVSITCGTAGATFYYTLDGSIPNSSSPVYSGPIHLTYSVTLRAFAAKTGMADSVEVSKAISIVPSMMRASVDTNGIQGGGISQTPVISADGRYIAFTSAATNLVVGDTNANTDIFVYDCQTNQTTLVSVNSTGVQGNSASVTPSISADGRYVAFASAATNLVAGDTNGFNDIFVYDRQTAGTTRVSVSSTGVQATNASSTPVISADGRYVAFVSTATNLVTGDTNGYNDIFVYDRQTAATTRVSVGSGAVQATNASLSPTISADGRYVAFVSTATNLITGDTNGYNDIFLYDQLTAQTTRVSVSSLVVQATNASLAPSISADGRYIAYASTATNLVTDDTNSRNDIFVYDRLAGQTSRINLKADGTQGNNHSLNPAFAANGRYVAFQSDANNLVEADGNAVTDVFVYDRGP